jgi:hypothetical protein
MRSLLRVDVLTFPRPAGAIGYTLRLPRPAGGGKAWLVAGIGRLLILAGVVAIAAGVVLLFLPRIPWFGRLPGDIVVQRERVTFYFPIVTSIVVSIVLTILVNLFFRR